MSEVAGTSSWKFWVLLVVAMVTALMLSFYGVMWIGGAGSGQGRPPFVEGDMRSHIERLGQKRAVVIAREGCPACAAARKWAAQEKIELTFVDLNDSKDAIDVMRQIGSTGVPTLLVAGASYRGFDATRWEELLAQ
jgi:glutaredoxin